MGIVLAIILLLLNLLNVFCHTVGSYLLICLYRNGRESSQLVYLINLSICEALMNLLEALRRIPNMIEMPTDTIKVIDDFSLKNSSNLNFTNGEKFVNGNNVTNFSNTNLNFSDAANFINKTNFINVTDFINGIDLMNMTNCSNFIDSTCMTNSTRVIRRIIENVNNAINSSNRMNIPSHTTKVINDVQNYMLIVMFTGISLVYYMDMLYLTLDKFMEILLNIRYPVYWNELKARWLLLMTWVVGALLSITVSLLYRFAGYNWEEAFFKYFFPTLEFGFIILASITYAFIFHKYKEARHLPAQNASRDQQATNRQGCFQVFRQSRFYITVLLILTFIVFMIIPDITYLFVAIINGNQSETLAIACWISYAISNLADAWIYIFLFVPAKKLLFKKLHIRRTRSNVTSDYAMSIVMQSVT